MSRQTVILSFSLEGDFKIMARRTGVPSLMFIARRLCILIVKFTPVIMQVYPTSTALHAALAAANAACATLHEQLAAVRAYGD